ncbi:MAG: helix-turn-helix transcriptional regulator [Lachnospiraceae bacterium]|nr:helix-turn-helix transcriptional regulator [Lachnospiraceae bacterium]
MKILHYGLNLSHDMGQFCERNMFEHYVISCFQTPFLYEANNSLQRGAAGEILIMQPGTYIYHGPQDKQQSFINDFLYVKGKDLDELLMKFQLPLNISFDIGDAAFLNNSIKRIKNELLLKSVGYEEMISCILTETVISMYRLYNRYNNFHSSMERIESAREKILRHPARNWTLQSMAELSGYSVSRFGKLYYKYFGSTPKAELISNRIELAKQYLQYGELTITEIAEQSGFNSPYYFSKYFKEVVGISPSEYTKRLHNKNISD